MANDLNKNELDKETQAFLDQMDQVELPAGTRSKEDLWAEIDAATEEVPSKTSRSLWPWYAAAASVAILLGFFFLQQSSPVQVATANGETRRVQLTDGSIVTLNAQSTLNYKEGDPRNVSLDGEAFFEVTKGGDFVITTAQGTVSVLGTSFNVLDRGSDYRVLCKTGRVRVDIPKSDFSQEITAGGAVIKSEKEVLVDEIAVDQVASWLLGELYFENASLQRVVEELERQYDIKITIENIENKRFTGYITIDELAESLAMVCEPLGLSFEITDDKSATIRQD
ncbi:MAG: FecR domain-containing protein [Cyclobacteriaceae bacterium]